MIDWELEIQDTNSISHFQGLKKLQLNQAEQNIGKISAFD